MTGTTEITVTVDTDLEAFVSAKVHKLNVRLRRHGDRLELVTREPFTTRRTPDSPFALSKVRLTYSVPVLGGECAKLVGSFELAEDKVALYCNPMPGYVSADLEPFKARWQECDHCHTNRRRLASFVCERQDGTRVIIGRSCSMAYIGLSPERIAGLIMAWQELTRSEEEMECERNGGVRTFPTHDVVEFAHQVAQHFGGYSKDMKYDFAEHVQVLMFGAKSEGQREIARIYNGKGFKALDWAALAAYVQTGNSEFAHNFATALSQEYVAAKRFPLIIAGVGLFVGRLIRTEKEAAVEATQAPAKHLAGELKQRLTFRATVERTIPYNGAFGPGLVVAMRCEDGARVVHFTSGAERPEAGHVYDVKATIKSHGESRRDGKPETVVSRAVYVEAA